MKCAWVSVMIGVMQMVACAQPAARDAERGALTPERAKTDPGAVFERYLAAVRARDMGAVLALASDDIARVRYPGCTPEMDNKACFGTYIRQAVVDADGQIDVKGVEVQGDTLLAQLELRSELTRRAGVDRALGTDRIRVVDDFIVEFAFIPDFRDQQTASFFASLGVRPPPE